MRILLYRAFVWCMAIRYSDSTLIGSHSDMITVEWSWNCYVSCCIDVGTLIGSHVDYMLQRGIQVNSTYMQCTLWPTGPPWDIFPIPRAGTDYMFTARPVRQIHTHAPITKQQYNRRPPGVSDVFPDISRSSCPGDYSNGRGWARSPIPLVHAVSDDSTCVRRY